MSWLSLQQEFNVLIQASFGLRHDVKFDRSQAVSLKDDQIAALSVWPMPAAAVRQSAGLCPTACLAGFCVDIYARDRETCGNVFDQLKTLLRETGFSAGEPVRCDPEPLYNENVQTDALRAVILYQYID